MLSSSFDISEFMKKVEGHSNQEIIYMADLEATAAERFIFKHKPCRQSQLEPEDCRDARKYAVLLKDFVQYMRYGVSTQSVQSLNLALPGTLGH